jgi:3-hydroxyisobutyrate dehydrogenase-like beta-hydroxyacid dehydrogenase
MKTYFIYLNKNFFEILCLYLPVEGQKQSKVVLHICVHYESRDTVPVQGEEGLLAGLSPGKVWIDHSTTDYEQARRYDYFTT